jgi:hypothetical protein
MIAKDFLFDYVFDRKHDISNIIMSYIKGRYYDGWKCTKYLNIACQLNYIFMLDWLNQDSIICTKNSTYIAAGDCNIDMLIYLKNKYNISSCINDANNAAGNGHIDMLIYLKQEYNVICDANGANNAAGNGHINMLIYLKQEYNVICDANGANNAASNGHINMLIYLKQEYNVICDANGANNAVSNGHIDVLRYLRQECNINCHNTLINTHFTGVDNICSDIINKIIKNGLLDTLIYINIHNNIQFTSGMLILCIKYNQRHIYDYICSAYPNLLNIIDIFNLLLYKYHSYIDITRYTQYIINNQYRLYSRYINIIAKSIVEFVYNIETNCFSSSGLYYTHIIQYIIFMGNIDNLVYLKNIIGNLTITTRCMHYAISGGNIDMVKYIHTYVEITHDHIATAIYNNQLDILMYLTNQLICDVNIIARIDITNHLQQNNTDIILYLYKTYKICTSSLGMNMIASYGHINLILTYISDDIRFNNICNIIGVDNAAKNGHLNILVYLKNKHNIICSIYGANNAAENGHINVLRYLKNECNIIPTIDCVKLIHKHKHRHIINFMCNECNLQFNAPP